MIINLGRQSNFNELKPDEWIAIECLVRKQCQHRLTLAQLREAMELGVRGKYNEKQFQVNGFTILKWIDLYIEDMIEKQNRMKSKEDY